MERDAFNEILVREDDSLLDTLRVIDQGRSQIALMVDDDGLLIGTVTDGDIRRGLLRRVTLDAPISEVAHRDFTAVKRGTLRHDALDLMLSKTIKVLPVVDETGRAVDIVTLHEVLRGAERPNWAVLMAGGKGTRLRPFTETLPKPMLPIGDRPLLERIVMHLVAHGIRRIFISVNYLGRMIEDHFEDGARWNCKISYLREDRPLGTGGCLSLLPEAPTAPVILMNGDLLTQLHVGRLLDHHQDNGFVATMGVRDYEVRVPYGVAETDGAQLVGLVEKPAVNYSINAGIYVLSPEAVAMVPDSPDLYPITELFNTAMGQGQPVGAFHIQEEWVDVGHTEHYLAHHQQGIGDDG